MPKRKNKIPGWIDQYAKAVRRFTFNHDHDPGSHLPFNAFRFYPLYFNVWLDKIYQAIILTNRRKYGSGKIIKAMPAYGSLKYIFYTLVNMAGYFDYDVKRAKVIFDFFVKIMQSISADKNIFNEYENILRTPSQLKPIIAGLKKVSGEQEKKTLAKFIGILAMYNHALYNDFSTEFGYSIEGPYQLNAEEQLVIRHFPNLNPKELWPSLAGIKLSNIVVCSIYKNIRLKMRFTTTHLITKDNYQDKLAKYLIFINDKPMLNSNKLFALTTKIAERTAQIYQEQKKLNFERTKIKFLTQQAYELKGLFDLAGLNWRPGQELLNKVRNKKLKSGGIIKMSYPANKKEYEDYVGVSYLKKVYG